MPLSRGHRGRAFAPVNDGNPNDVQTRLLTLLHATRCQLVALVRHQSFTIYAPDTCGAGADCHSQEISMTPRLRALIARARLLAIAEELRFTIKTRKH
jgi:hypothetical protein